MPEGDSEDAHHGPFGYLVDVGSRFFNRTLETKTPGPSDTALGTPLLTSTCYVERVEPSQAEQNTDLNSMISESITAH